MRVERRDQALVDGVGMLPPRELDSGQLGMLPGEDPDALVAQATRQFSPIKTFALFSGGTDSQALAIRCRDRIDALAFLDTGTAIPGVIDHVREFAVWLDKPLREIREYEDDPFKAYRYLVLGRPDERQRPGFVALGFPGPGQHGRAYNRLKERQIERLLRETKVGHPRTANVLFLSGIRRAESKAREKRMPITRRWSDCYANPLIDWGNRQTSNYVQLSGAPQSDVAALLHRSGECNCGAYPTEDERGMLKSLWPAWWARIEALEAEAEALGIRWCRWGGYDLDGNRAGGDDGGGDLCQSCATRLFEPVAA